MVFKSPIRNLKMKGTVVPKRGSSNLRKVEEGGVTKRTRTVYTKAPKPRKLEEDPPTLCDLPVEIIEMILGFADFNSRQALRATCSTLKCLHDDFLEHKCKKLVYFKDTKQIGVLFQPRLLLKEFCKVIYENTIFFRSLKIFPLFLTIFLSYSDLLSVRGLHSSVIAKISNAKFISDVSDVFEKLFQNYLKTAQLITSNCNNKARIILILTVLHLLSNCPTAKLKKKLKSQNYLEYEFTISGAWLGCLWSKNKKSSFSLQIILVILIEILTSIQMQQSFRKVIDVEESVIVFGNEICLFNNPRVPTSKFQFHMNSEIQVIDFIDTVLKTSTLTCLEALRMKKFYFALDISCQEARKWGCSDSYLIYR